MNKKLTLFTFPFLIIVILTNCTTYDGQYHSIATSTVDYFLKSTNGVTIEQHATQNPELSSSTEITQFIPNKTATSTASISITPIPSPTIPVDSRLELKCLREMNTPVNGIYTGTIILGGYTKNPTYLFDLDKWELMLLNENQKDSQSIDEKVSTDNMWLAYYDLQNSALIVRNKTGDRKIEISWEQNWFRIINWLNNSELLISLRGGSYLVLNPFTGERHTLNNDLPLLQGPIGIGSDWWGPVYNSNLTRVVYPAIGSKIILWNMDTTQPMTTLSSGGGQPFGSDKPVWSLEGNEFIISYQPSDLNQSTLNSELFVVNDMGKQNQITNLGAFYKESSSQSGYSWSPDGTKVAFWSTYKINRNENIEQQLAIVDLLDMKVTQYCVSGNIYGISQAPVWSPSSDKLVVEAIIDNNINGNLDNLGIFFIDISKGSIYQITKGDYRLGGWLK